MQLEPLIRPLTARGAVLHVGPGTLGGHAAYPATDATVVLVEPDPLKARALGRKLKPRDGLQLLVAALRPEGAAGPFVRYNLPDLDGFRAPTGARTLFPNLRATGEAAVATVDLARVLELLGPTQGRDVLIVEAVGEELALLAELERCGALGRFARIVLRPGRQALVEGGASAAAVTDWLTARHFAEPVTLDGSDPDWPVLLFPANPLSAPLEALTAEAAQRTADLAQAETRAQGLASDLQKTQERCRNLATEREAQEARLEALAAESAQRATDLAEAEARAQGLTSDLQGLQETCQRLESEREALVVESAQRAADLAEAEARAQTFASDLRHLRERYRRLEAERKERELLLERVFRHLNAADAVPPDRPDRDDRVPS